MKYEGDASFAFLSASSTAASSWWWWWWFELLDTARFAARREVRSSTSPPLGGMKKVPYGHAHSPSRGTKNQPSPCCCRDRARASDNNVKQASLTFAFLGGKKKFGQGFIGLMAARGQRRASQAHTHVPTYRALGTEKNMHDDDDDDQAYAGMT